MKDSSATFRMTLFEAYIYMSKKLVTTFLAGIGLGIAATVLFSDPDGNLSQKALKKKLKKFKAKKNTPKKK